jgi:hypothetical protein
MAIDPVMREISKELMLDAAAALEAKDAEIKALAGALQTTANIVDARNIEIAKLKKLLEPFATIARCAIRTKGDEGMGLFVPLRHLDAAAAALEQSMPQRKE